MMIQIHTTIQEHAVSEGSPTLSKRELMSNEKCPSTKIIAPENRAIVYALHSGKTKGGIPCIILGPNKIFAPRPTDLKFGRDTIHAKH
jgi:hypothetical protein